MTRVLIGTMILLAAAAVVDAQIDWGINRQIVAGRIGQYGIGADRTPGPDTVFLGVIRGDPEGDTVQLFRTTDRGEHWSLVWQARQAAQRLTNLVLRVGSGNERWVFMFWVADDGLNNGDVRGVRVSFDGSLGQDLNPTVPGAPDTLRWVAFTRSFLPNYRLHLFWQDEAGLSGQARNPVIRYSFSTDFGIVWSNPRDLIYGFETPAVDYGAPGYLYVVARSVTKQDIGLAATTDEGESWNVSWLTDDTTYNNDMFPSVAATHDSARGSMAWVSYDSYRHDATVWSVYCAYTANGGATWTLDRALSSGSGDQYWSSLECAGYGLRRARVVYLARDSSGSLVRYRDGSAANPALWTPPLTVNDRQATNTMAPLITNYGIAGDSANQGLVFYAEPGPVNLWYNAYQFIGTREERFPPSIGRMSAALDRDVVRVAFSLARGSDVKLALYDVGGRRVAALTTRTVSAGSQVLSLPVRALQAGAYLLRLTAGRANAVCKLVYCP